MVNKKSLAITEDIIKGVKEQIAAIFEQIYSEESGYIKREVKALEKTIVNAINRRLGEWYGCNEDIRIAPER